MLKETRGVIVYVSSLKFVKNLKRFGTVSYVSKRMKYVVLYVDSQQVEALQKRLKSFHFVRKVELSYRAELKTEFENAKMDMMKEKEYNFEAQLIKANV